MHTASFAHKQLPPLESDLTSKDFPPFGPLMLEYQRAKSSGSFKGFDGSLVIRYGEQEHTFLVEYKKDWTRRTLNMALEQIEHRANNLSTELPLVLLPYLDDEKLGRLAAKEVSGMDLCGNAVVIVPGRWFLRFSGRLNRFKSSAKLKEPYAGKASLVGRTLLKRPVFMTATDLIREIKGRGGSLSQPLVSRALSALTEDLIVGERAPERILLLQPNRLIDRLAEAWSGPKPQVLWRGRVAAKTAEFLPTLFTNAERARLNAVVTGLGSASRYASVTMEDVVYLYVDRAEPLLEGLDAKPGERFANLELCAPPDDLVFYDIDEGERGVRWASDVQTYLEMRNAGARMRDSAEGLRQRIIDRANKLKGAA